MLFRSKGKITSFAGGKFTIAMGEGSRRRELTFFANEVESIRFDDESSAASSAPTRKYEPAQLPVTKVPAVVKNDTGTISQQPTVIQQQPPRVVQTSASVPMPGRSTPPRPAASAGGPITWDIKVLADNTANGWTNTGWVVKKGQRIRISGDGKISLGKGRSSSPSGEPDIEDQQKLLKNVATGALLAVIGDDNNDFIYVGAEREFVATRDGALFLGINEGYLDDNSGSYAVKVEILPNDGN